MIAENEINTTPNMKSGGNVIYFPNSFAARLPPLTDDDHRRFCTVWTQVNVLLLALKHDCCQHVCLQRII